MRFKKVIRTKWQFVERWIKTFEKVEKNLGTCYLLAAEFVLKHSKEKEIKMIIASMIFHGDACGLLLGEPRQFPDYIHAFVEMGDICYDPVIEMAFSKELFYDLFNVRKKSEYTAKEVYINVVKYGFHYFNWAHAKKDRTTERDLAFKYPPEFIEWICMLCKKMDVSFYQENLVTNDFFQKVRIIYRLKEAGYFHIPSMYKGFLVLKEEGALRKI